MKEKTTLQLITRLNDMLKEYDELELQHIKADHAIKELDEEWNKICYELWDRIPGLKGDVNIQPKIKKKERS